MESGALEPIRELMDQAYQTESGKKFTPETEQGIEQFEQKHNVRIPAAYREFLLSYGACHFVDPALYGIKELEWAYPEFKETLSAYRQEYALPPELDPFPIGGFGEGSMAILDQATGKVFMLIHDYIGDMPLEEVAVDLADLLTMQAEMGLLIEGQIHGSSS